MMIPTTAILLLLGACVPPVDSPAQARDGATVGPAGAVAAGVAAGQAPKGESANDEARAKLLADALAVAEMLPTDYHARERAKLQEAVGAAMVEAGLLDEARRVVPRIAGWRGASLLAKIALVDARQGRNEQARALADRVVAASKGSGVTDWQREALSVAAARIHAQLGDDARANELERGVGEAEQGKVAATRAAAFPDTTFDAQMALAEGWIKTLNFDLSRNAVDIAIGYYPACFEDSARRARVEALVEAANKHLALDLRVDGWLRLAEIAREKSDRAAASAFIAKAEAVRASAQWAPEDETSLLSRIAAAKARLGDAEGARRDLESAMAIFDGGKDRIIDIFRAGPLRAVAESQVVLGDLAAARAVYMRALEEGSLNPNARPRAGDLVASMLSMVATGVLPDEAAAARIAAIREGLVDPW